MRSRIAMSVALAFVVALVAFQGVLTDVLGTDLMDVVFAAAPSVVGLLCWHAAGNRLLLGTTWAVPLFVVNAAAIMVLPMPASLIVGYGVIATVAAFSLLGHRLRDLVQAGDSACGRQAPLTKVRCW